MNEAFELIKRNMQIDTCLRQGTTVADIVALGFEESEVLDRVQVAENMKAAKAAVLAWLALKDDCDLTPEDNWDVGALSDE